MWRSRPGGQSLAYLHAGQSHLLQVFVGCSVESVESLVHTSRRAKRGMSPYWTTLCCANAADKSRPREFDPASPDHVPLSDYVAF
jgi:hypothetical protein